MVFVKRFIGLAAVFSVAVGAPSGIRRTESKEDYSPSSYDSSKSYNSNSKDYNQGSNDYNQGSDYNQNSDYNQDSSYDEKSNYNDKSYKTTTAEYNQYTQYNNKEYETSTEYDQQYDYTTSEYETSTEDSTSTSTAYDSYPTYGSGSSNWDSQGYDDCVSKCLADYGSKDKWYKPSTTQDSSSDSGYEGSTGTGATHTVIVAPTQGVLRYMPFVVNASIGDTVKFMWGANTHTVTKGSALLPCNKTADDSFFTSGSHDKDFVFTQVVNTTDPTYFFCNTPGHCQKGMFGIINPTSAQDAPSSASLMMSDLKANNADLKAYAAIVDKNTVNNDVARNWGGNIAIGSLPEWAQPLAAENILFTRSVLAANPDLIKNNAVDMSSVSNTPMMVPDDVSAALANAAAAPAATTPAAANPPAASPSDAVPTQGAAAGAQNSASSMGSPRVFVALMVVVATFLAL